MQLKLSGARAGVQTRKAPATCRLPGRAIRCVRAWLFCGQALQGSLHQRLRA
jgi:hypothetical protein